jgi:hypothetical protein
VNCGGRDELCDVLANEGERYLLVQDNRGHSFIAVRRLGAWQRMPMTDVLFRVATWDVRGLK